MGVGRHRRWRHARAQVGGAVFLFLARWLFSGRLIVCHFVAALLVVLHSSFRLHQLTVFECLAANKPSSLSAAVVVVVG